jgi:hypothetical protein
MPGYGYRVFWENAGLTVAYGKCGKDSKVMVCMRIMGKKSPILEE